MLHLDLAVADHAHSTTRLAPVGGHPVEQRDYGMHSQIVSHLPAQ